jgi:hypothetical protein
MRCGISGMCGPIMYFLMLDCPMHGQPVQTGQIADARDESSEYHCLKFPYKTCHDMEDTFTRGAGKHVSKSASRL